MKMFYYKDKIKNKRILISFFIVIIIFLSWITYNQFKTPEKVLKVPPKKTTYSLSSIGLSIKKDGYLFTTKDNGYKKLKLAIEDVLNDIEKPALESNTIPESEDKDNKKIVTINEIKEKTVNVGSIIYVNDHVKTKIKITPELEKLGYSDDDSNLIIPVHEFIIILSGEYKGLLFTKTDQDTKRWSAWEINKDSIQKLTELIREGIK